METEQHVPATAHENGGDAQTPVSVGSREHLYASRTVLFTSVISSVVSSLVFVGFLAYFSYQYRADLLPHTPPRVSERIERNVSDSVFDTQEPIVRIVEEAKNAVVSVVITKDVPVLERYYERIDPFEGWGSFGGITVPRVRERGTEEREVGGGTGFFVSNDGMMVTNRHVVSDTDARYSIITNDGDSYEAEVLVRDPHMDIALLRVRDIPGDSYAYLTFGDSAELRLGQTVIAIGNALTEFRNSVSVGVVSGLSRSITAGSRRGGMIELLEGVIQTDAAINPGNSGGPLLDLRGNVIGVNVAVAGGAENIGFALPGNMVKGVVDSVKEFGEIRRPYLGVRYIMLNETIAKNNELPVSYGAWIRGSVDGPAVVKDSPAMRAGLLENDIIVSLSGVSFERDDTSLATLMRQKSVGDRVEIVFIRNGERRTIAVTLESAPSEM